MGAKHRMTASSEQRYSPARRGARRGMAGASLACEILTASMLCAATLTVLVSNGLEPQKRTVEATQDPPVSESVRQQGTVIAVSADSVTARSANGYTQTYRVTPNTAVISRGGSQPAAAAWHFTINEQVDIVGEIQNGTALATAVADRDTANGGGLPMDHIAAQPISDASGGTKGG